MLPHRRNMLNETETALNVNAPCSCKYSIIFCLTSQSEPRILFRSPRSVVGWFPPYAKIRTDGCCLSNQHSASTHIIHWIQTRVLIWILSNRTAHWFIGFCDWILLREKRCESCRIAAVHLTYPVYHAVFSLSTPNHLNLPAFFCRIWQKTVLLCLRCTFFCIDITFSYLRHIFAAFRGTNLF